MIFSILLLCAREDLLPSLFSPRSPRLCDQVLPLRSDLRNAIYENLSPKEKELFIHRQWQVYTPFLTEIARGKVQADLKIDEEVSLPWATKERIGERFPGEVSFVEKVKIHPCSNNLVRKALGELVQDNCY